MQEIGLSLHLLAIGLSSVRQFVSLPACLGGFRLSGGGIEQLKKRRISAFSAFSCFTRCSIAGVTVRSLFFSIPAGMGSGSIVETGSFFSQAKRTRVANRRLAKAFEIQYYLPNNHI